MVINKRLVKIGEAARLLGTDHSTLRKWESTGELLPATRNAIDDLDNAFTHFFCRVKKGEKAGYPRFKKRGEHDSFALREKSKFDVDGQTLRFTGTPCQVTISKRA